MAFEKEEEVDVQEQLQKVLGPFAPFAHIGGIVIRVAVFQPLHVVSVLNHLRVDFGNRGTRTPGLINAVSQMYRTGGRRLAYAGLGASICETVVHEVTHSAVLAVLPRPYPTERHLTPLQAVWEVAVDVAAAAFSALAATPMRVLAVRAIASVLDGETPLSPSALVSLEGWGVLLSGAVPAMLLAGLRALLNGIMRHTLPRILPEEKPLMTDEERADLKMQHVTAHILLGFVINNLMQPFDVIRTRQSVSARQAMGTWARGHGGLVQQLQALRASGELVRLNPWSVAVSGPPSRVLAPPLKDSKKKGN
eukprot:Colp12_sorted_trinity150504_noHs@28716